MDTHPEIEKQIEQVLSELKLEIQRLQAQNILRDVDQAIILNQAQVSAQALVQARNIEGMPENVRVKLQEALIRDLETAIWQHLENAIGRQGAKARLIYRLNRVERRIIAKQAQMGTSQGSSTLNRVNCAMSVLRLYILRSVTDEKGRLPRVRKINLDKIEEDYEAALTEALKMPDVELKQLQDGLDAYLS